jgi:hypothetical protein
MLNNDDLRTTPVNHTLEYILYGANIIVVIWEIYIIIKCLY